MGLQKGVFGEVSEKRIVGDQGFLTEGRRGKERKGSAGSSSLEGLFEGLKKGSKMQRREAKKKKKKGQNASFTKTPGGHFFDLLKESAWRGLEGDRRRRKKDLGKGCSARNTSIT